MKTRAYRRRIARALALGAFSIGTVASAQDETPSSEDTTPSEAPASKSQSAPASSTKTPKEADDGAALSADDNVGTEAANGSQDVALDKAGASVRIARFWVGIAGSLDWAFSARANDVCLLNTAAKPLVSPGDYCATPYGSDFPNRAVPAQNAAILPGHAGALDGGVKLSDVRVLVAADYAVTDSLLVGLRLGYVLNAYPGDAALSGRPAFFRNLHVEARGTYVFGKDALARVAFAPLAFLGAGVATMDTHARTSVSLAGVRGQTPINAWQISGPGLVVLGGGARYGFSPRAAFTAAWKLSLGFGAASTLFTMGPEVGFQYGF